MSSARPPNGNPCPSGSAQGTRSKTGSSSVRETAQNFDSSATATSRAHGKSSSSYGITAKPSSKPAVRPRPTQAADDSRARIAQLEQQLGQQNQLIESQFQRENDDKRHIEELKKRAENGERERDEARRFVTQLKQEYQRLATQKGELEQKAHQNLQSLQNSLTKKEKEVKHLEDTHRQKLQTLQQELEGERQQCEREKSRTKLILQRCLVLLRSSREGDGIFHGRLGISFESSQQERKYESIALKIINEIEPNASIVLGARPDQNDYDIVLHLARTEGGRTVNLEQSKRQAFKCDNVILILLRSGTNPDVYNTFVPPDANEYSGILLGRRGERRVILQLLHWQSEWVDCKLNEDNVKLLKELVKQACPKMVEQLHDDQLIKALGLGND
ncbi:uncharacterized protein LOC134194820 [Corticium candelabrum]|uniref:uncharacterized protein LOC134194820 n=1 Tax=Corticium candelabrum TaxID=121492 RepID=UPI002E271580|nr:uncharacterized protein LOC134194820 [Corticium candelabrum]